ncbi:MAG: acetyl-CoA carboxylase, carboxyltransferase subunit beta [Thermodesulfovibrionales bacterium]|nr:acetyl-CoA carboxylase, carboxyltransferase subunit beta [Thermodesulfovibrionales bacterium]
MAWFKKPKEISKEKKVRIPEGLWVKCENCKEIVYRKEVEKNLQVCPKCDYHFRISAVERLNLLLDPNTFEEMDANLLPADPLGFNDSNKSYPEKLREYQSKTKLKEAVITGEGLIKGHPVIVAAMDFSFFGGSMGSVVGEKIARAAERAIAKKQPFIAITASGGARMQEGMFSLMQMAKVSQAISRLKEEGVLYITILCDPTFGGVTASFAMLGDIIIAEPKTLIGFAGPRVIEQTTKQPLPEDFQRAEFLLSHGFVDMVVERKDLKKTVALLIELFMANSTR